jgi:protein-tyrosine phosphatase
VVSQQFDALAVDGLVNLRDLGGLPTASGATTLPGRLLRSESPHSLRDAGLRALLDLGVSTVVDLRTTAERERRPNELAAAGVTIVHAPIFTDEEEYPDHLATAAEVYCWWLRERGSGVAMAMRAVADSASTPILVHCHAGKDRTGVVIALVLRLAGVPTGPIADDYAISGVQLAEKLARDRVRAMEGGMNEVVAERLFTVRHDAMVQFVECVETEHGGAASLMRELGLDEPAVERLETLLLTPVWP